MKKILIFAGTTEGRRVSEILSENKINHTVCVATEYGEMLIEKNEFVNVHCERMDAEKMNSFIKEGAFETVIDATHPYAFEVTKNIKEAVSKNNQGIKYIRLKRNTGIDIQNETIRFFDSNEECAKALEETKGNILLTTGSKELSVYANNPDLKERLFVRIIPGEESLKICNTLGISGKNIIAMQGPFSSKMNEATIDMYEISVMVTKQSGIAGGFPQKAESAKNKNIPLFVIGCPVEDEGLSIEETLKEINVKACGKEAAKIHIDLIGAGMGNPDLLTKKASKAIDEADVIIGAKRLLEIFETNARKLPLYMAGDIIPAIKEIQSEGRTKKIAVLFSGDSSFYSGASPLYEALTEEIKKGGIVADIAVIPGISSISYLSSKIGISYSDALILSIHGRRLKNIAKRIKHSRKTFLLVSGLNDIKLLGEKLVDSGIDNVKIYAGGNLSYEDEEIFVLTPKECVSFDREGIYTLYIDNTESEERRAALGLKDGEFERNETAMTKEEVREVSICKLRPRKDSVIWDIGCGTGSIAVECALLSDEIIVYGIEMKDDAVEIIDRNKEKFGLENINVIKGKAPDALKDLPAATNAFIGGSGGNLNGILNMLYKVNPNMRVVINAVTIETMCEMKKIPDNFEVKDFEIIQMQVSRANTAGEYHMMKAENSVWICSFDFDPVSL